MAKNYNKPYLSFKQQVAKFFERRLNIQDTALAENYLQMISYHRLNSYRFPFLEEGSRESYKNSATFQDLIDLYNQDITYKSILIILLQFIEIAFKTQLIYHFSKDNHFFYAQENNYIIKNPNLSSNQITNINKKKDEVQLEKYNDFKTSHNKIMQDCRNRHNIHISYYRENYCKCPTKCQCVPQNPEDKKVYSDCKCPTKCQCVPPAWIAFEGLSLGQLIFIYNKANFNDEIKNKIANFFNLSEYKFLIALFTDISRIRNIIAHYDKILDRKSFIPSESFNTLLFLYKKIDKKQLQEYKNTYLPYFLIIKHLSKILIDKNPDNIFLKDTYHNFLSLSKQHANHLSIKLLDDSYFQ